MVLQNFSFAASIYSIINILQISTNLAEAARFAGTSKGAPAFALFLGGLLPFVFWGIWYSKSKILRIISVIGFTSGLITLVFTGQRTGTITGLISIIPMILLFFKEGRIKKLLTITALFCICAFIFRDLITPVKLNFLLNRYSINSGLSSRDLIWKVALNEILINPINGHGFGASEQVITSSFHNGFLEVWFNTGIVGLFFYCCSLLVFLIHAVKQSFMAASFESRVISSLAIGYIFGFIFSNLFESIGASSSSLNLLLFLSICALIPSNGKNKKIRQRVTNLIGTNPVNN
jgi:O-antigen ligase